MSSKPQDYDEAFSYIAQQAGSIDNLLDAFFGFLHRKTDFYVEINKDSLTSKQYRMGFPEGVAKNMVLNSFKRYPMKKYEDALKAIDETAAQDIPKAPTVKKPISEPVLSIIHDTKPHNKVVETSAQSKSQDTVKEAGVSNSMNSSPSVRLTEAGKQIPIGNGGVTDRYYWTQTLKDITIFIDIPENTKSKEVKCVIKPSSLSVTIKGETFLEGVLEEVIRSQESMWTISSEKVKKGGGNLLQVVITLEKIRETWWKHAIVGDPEIDTSLVSRKN